jgi:hypothetical protein
MLFPGMLGAVVGMGAYGLYRAKAREDAKRKMAASFCAKHTLELARSLNVARRDPWGAYRRFAGCP